MIQLDETKFLKSNRYLARNRPGVNIRSIRQLVLIQRKKLFPYQTNHCRPFNDGKKCDRCLKDFDSQVLLKIPTILTKLHQSIIPLDMHIISGLPCPVLKETFLRKRTYYSYAPENFSFKDLQPSAQTAFPKEELTWESKLDPH